MLDEKKEIFHVFKEYDFSIFQYYFVQVSPSIEKKNHERFKVESSSPHMVPHQILQMTSVNNLNWNFLKV